MTVREVVHGVSCAGADGELAVVVGPSGCGKSTLLRTVAGRLGVRPEHIRLFDRAAGRRL